MLVSYNYEDPSPAAMGGYAIIALIDISMVVGLIAHYVFGWIP